MEKSLKMYYKSEQLLTLTACVPTCAHMKKKMITNVALALINNIKYLVNSVHLCHRNRLPQ